MTSHSESEQSRGEISSSSVQLCHCGAVSPIRTATTDGNEGRKFRGCGRFSTDGKRCSFFRWVDEIPYRRCKGIVAQMNENIADCEDEISDCRAREIELLAEIKDNKKKTNRSENDCKIAHDQLMLLLTQQKQINCYKFPSMVRTFFIGFSLAFVLF
ncbi:uncharacterized protein LOC131172216 [Hevea brasiliensis]|uniref:uncharacterized protein LOC131172216 n=1 Tax=Hevea brasiliensis TaxID=3981 RepID=UPI0025F2807E|nr:uncharacterized protein LOC131172216 [Hevea brasiliensis]